ncbi:hypothetical protein BDR06DRAFT_958421 [Suillus hirtellus]|nr:hypothetical protein BDR06DRAFT_958421 [Suillus hirtellus]
MVGIFFEKHVCKSPWPKVTETSFAAMMQHTTMYHTMNGPSEFTITGMLKSWSCLDQIHTITTPTLLTNGRLHESFFQRIPHVKWAQSLQRHMPFLEKEEDQTRYLQVVTDFLTCA